MAPTLGPVEMTMRTRGKIKILQAREVTTWSVSWLLKILILEVGALSSQRDSLIDFLGREGDVIAPGKVKWKPLNCPLSCCDQEC